MLRLAAVRWRAGVDAIGISCSPHEPQPLSQEPTDRLACFRSAQIIGRQFGGGGVAVAGRQACSRRAACCSGSCASCCVKQRPRL